MTNNLRPNFQVREVLTETFGQNPALLKASIPTAIADNLQAVATEYSRSPATSNAGRVLRFLAKIVPVSVIVKILAHQLSK